MTRKDFELIAAVIQNLKLPLASAVKQQLCKAAIAADFAEALKITNSQFNAARFFTAAIGGKQ